MHKSLVLAAVLLGASSLHAQVIESIEVRVTNVDVVVTDSKGNPVAGLSKDDFDLFEDGKKQDLTNFYEVRGDEAKPAANAQSADPAAEPPVEMRKRRVVFFIDNYSIHPFRRNEVFRAIDKQLDQIVRDGDEAMIATWSRGLRIVQPFTTDRSALRAAMKEVGRNGAVSINLATQRKMAQDRVNMVIQSANFARRQPTPDELASVVRAYADEVALNAKLLIESVNATITALSGMEGKKVLVFAGAHLPDKPAAELFQWLGNMASAASLNVIAQASNRSLSVDIEKLARNANANGVTMYMIDTADLEGNGAEVGEIPDPNVGFTEYTNTAIAFQAIAKITGGVALTASRNFDLAVQTVARDLGSYYSLGYRPSDGSPGSRRIAVKTKNPDYTIRSRSSYVAKTVEQQVEDRVISNIYNAMPSSELAIKLETAKPKRQGSAYLIPITVTIAPALTLLPQGGDVAGGFAVYIAVGDERGAMSKVSKQVQPIHITAAAAKLMMQKPLVYTADVMVRPGEHTMSVAVVDQVSNSAGFARMKVAAK